MHAKNQGDRLNSFAENRKTKIACKHTICALNSAKIEILQKYEKWSFLIPNANRHTNFHQKIPPFIFFSSISLILTHI